MFGKPTLRTLIAVGFLFFTATAFAEWKVERGPRGLGFSGTPPGPVAKASAKAPSGGVSAFLQVECFENPHLTSRMLLVVLSKETAPGAIAWRYQLDDQPPVQRGPHTRTSLKIISLGDSSNDPLKEFARTKRLRLTLLPMKSEELSFDFDISGADNAIKAIPCNEFNKM
jgi:hypothetical protein